MIGGLVGLLVPKPSAAEVAARTREELAKLKKALAEFVEAFNKHTHVVSTPNPPRAPYGWYAPKQPVHYVDISKL